jgi:hypothetical protein
MKWSAGEFKRAAITLTAAPGASVSYTILSGTQRFDADPERVQRRGNA